MSVQSYRDQRQRISPDELARHLGKWAAFSRDGSRIVASCETLEQLENKLIAAGDNPQELVYEFIGADEIMVGGAQFQ